MYKLLRSVLFCFDPESAHHFSMNALRLVCKVSLIKNIIRSRFTPENRITTVAGLRFRNPVGLGAGFDKNALYLSELDILGFGFVEIGTVTPLPQKGNARPRLFRLTKDKALLNRMGFNNDGAEIIKSRLENWRNKNSGSANFLIGVNIGKNKDTPNDEAWKDYEKCFMALHQYADYFVVNVSSPNTPGLRELQQKNSLKKILETLQAKETGKPIFLKISPDLSSAELDDILDLAGEIGLDGLIIANTTIARDKLITEKEKVEALGAGGISGKPLNTISGSLVRYAHDKLNGIPIIASGGIFNGVDATQRIEAGGSLVQVWTGFIYEGPSIVKNICSKL